MSKGFTILPAGTRIDPGDEIQVTRRDEELGTIVVWEEIPEGSRIGVPVGEKETVRRRKGLPIVAGRAPLTPAQVRRRQRLLKDLTEDDLEACATHEKRINGVLDVVYRREGFELIERHTPLDELMGAMVGDESDARMASLLPGEIIEKMLEYFFADGPHPGAVLRRLYAVVWARKPALAAHMNQSDIAAMFDESRAAMSWRVLKIFSGYLRKKEAKGFKASGQKSETANGKYAARAMGNSNRNKNKGTNHGHTEGRRHRH